MKMTWTIPLCALLLSATSHARMTVAEYESFDRAAGVRWLSVQSSLVDTAMGIESMNDFVLHIDKLRVICLPTAFGLTGPNLVGILDTEIRTNLEVQKTAEVSSVLMMGMIHAFPCK